MDQHPPVKLRARVGSYACGIETIESILQAALEVLVDEGGRAFTLRRIAGRCGMRLGNLSYYFPTKGTLVKELLESILSSYFDIIDHVFSDPDVDSEQKLKRIIVLSLQDMRTKRATNLFPELWALANHDAFVAERVAEYYRRGHQMYADLVSELNPALSPAETFLVGVFISASLEGLLIFVGHDKPWGPQIDKIAGITCETLIHLAKTITTEQIHSLEGSLPNSPQGDIASPPAKQRAIKRTKSAEKPQKSLTRM